MRLPQNVRNNVYRLNVSYTLRYVLKENIYRLFYISICLFTIVFSHKNLHRNEIFPYSKKSLLYSTFLREK
jgi:hypothetical protein